MTNPWTNNDGAFGPMFCDAIEIEASVPSNIQPEPTTQYLKLRDGRTFDFSSMSSPEMLDEFLFNNGNQRADIIELALSSNIGEYTFSGCLNLEKVYVFPTAVIGLSCFQHTPATFQSMYFKGKTMEQVKVMSDYPWGLGTSQLSTLIPEVQYPSVSASVFPIEDVDPFAEGDNITDIKATTVLVKKADWTSATGETKPAVGDKFTTTDGDNYKVYSIVPEQNWWKLVGRSY